MLLSITKNLINDDLSQFDALKTSKLREICFTERDKNLLIGKDITIMLIDFKRIRLRGSICNKPLKSLSEIFFQYRHFFTGFAQR